MSFGQRSGPPASPKQVDYLLALVKKAGYTGFREARYPLGLTQRQASGKFTRQEASSLIDRLLAGPDGDGTSDGEADGATSGATADPLDHERAEILRGMPAGLLAAELERRYWTVTPPTPGSPRPHGSPRPR